MSSLRANILAAELLMSLCAVLLCAGCGREEAPPTRQASESTPPATERRSSRPRPDAALHPKTASFPEEPSYLIEEERTPVKVPFHISVEPPGTALILTFDGRMVYESDYLPRGGVDLQLVPGRYKVMVNKAGWKPLQQQIKVLPDTVGWSVALEKVTGKLIVECQAGTAIKARAENDEVFDLGAVGETGKQVITSLSEGRYEIILGKPDYFSYTGRVDLVAGKPATIKTRLDGMPGQLLVGSSLAAEIHEGDVRWGTTGQRIEGITPGRYRIALSRRGYRTEYMDILVPPNRVLTVTAPDMIPEGGSLRVRAQSAVDADTFLATSPVEIQIDDHPWKTVGLPYMETGLPIGTHTIQMRSARYLPVQPDPQYVDVLDERTNDLVFVLQPLPVTLRLFSSREGADVFLDNERVSAAGEDIPLAPFVAYTLEARVHGFEPVVREVRFDEPGRVYEQTVEFTRPARFADLISIETARPVIGQYDLAPGSLEAAKDQMRVARNRGLALEVKTQKSGIHLRLIPPGVFYMGSHEDEPGRKEDEGPVSEVTISAPMYVGKYEITQAQWARVMGENPASFKQAGPHAPVETIDWEQALEFVNRLCEIEGVPYGTYRLLTEAEWEYCCRAGTTAPLYTGDITLLGANHAPELDAIAWYGGNSGVDYAGGQNSEEWAEKQNEHSRAGPHPVGEKAPNAFGVHDMLGNVWEWCSDRYANGYLAVMQVDPRGPSFGSGRVCRGGGWYSHARICRSAQRYSNSPKYRSNVLGLRIARTLPPSP